MNTVSHCLLFAVIVPTVMEAIMEAVLLGQCGCHAKSACCVQLSEEGEASAGDSVLPGSCHLHGATTEHWDVLLLSVTQLYQQHLVTIDEAAPWDLASSLSTVLCWYGSC